MSVTISIRLDDETAAWLDDLSATTGVPKGRLVKEALAMSRKKPKRRFMRLAGKIDGPSDLSQRKGFTKA